MEHYDPLAAPYPQKWLALDELERLDRAQDYLTAEEWLRSADDAMDGDVEAARILDQLTLGGPLPIEALRAADAGTSAATTHAPAAAARDSRNAA